jgi:transcriptional regulator with XRE-family HTH domain
MTEPSAAALTITQRIAQCVRDWRAEQGLSQAQLASWLTDIGIRTKPATWARIESGQQPIDVERLFALVALTDDTRLSDLVRGPFTIGRHVVDEDGAQTLLRTSPQWAPSPIDVDTGAYRWEQLTDMTGLDLSVVVELVQRLYGTDDVNAIVRQAHSAALADLPPESDARTGDGIRRAYQAHALRRIGRELTAAHQASTEHTLDEQETRS